MKKQQPLDYVPKPRYEERPLPQSSGVLGPQNFVQDNSQGTVKSRVLTRLV